MSKKADYIFETTKNVISSDVWRGRKYDSLTHVCYRNGDAPVQRTVNELMKLWNGHVHAIESEMAFMVRHPEYNSESRCASFARKVETARRLYLTIAGEQRRIQGWKEYMEGRITMEECMRL